MEKCRKMREAKERLRLANGVATESHVIGVVTFDGAAFGGCHVVRFVGRSDRPVVDVEVDGRVTCVKTPRGARALVLRRVEKCVIGNRTDRTDRKDRTKRKGSECEKGRRVD